MQNSDLFLKSIPKKLFQTYFFYNTFYGVRHNNFLEELVFHLTTLATKEKLKKFE